VGFNPQGLLQGLYRLEVPEQQGRFNPLLVAGAMIGAVGGSVMNLVYPYFLDAKGWKGPQYRRVYLGSHAWLRWKAGAGPIEMDYRFHPMYRFIVVWSLLPPLVWTLPGMPDFVTLTLVVNSGQVVLLPLLAGGLWWITASARFIGEEHRNRWWENALLGVLFVLALYGAVNAFRSIAGFLAEAPGH
jgi:hypothetical protein